MKTESVHHERLEEYIRDEVLFLVAGYICWHDHEHVNNHTWLDEPGLIPSKLGIGHMIIFKKTFVVPFLESIMGLSFYVEG